MCKLISIWKASQSLNRCQKGDNHVKLLTILTHDIPRLSLVFALHIMSTLFYRNWERVTSTIGYFFLWWAVQHHFRIIPLLGKIQLAPQGIFKLFQFLYRITPRILYENHGNSWNRLKPRQEKPCLWGKISKWSRLGGSFSLRLCNWA